ncbi:hypothetical protein [Streptomyces sp. NPDC053542]|uniref:hypothetical protein n=1 Tax=Streptomyces sp. NPDC053542 TaxID=3365710 RepID=UPI0037D3FBEC
MRSVERLVPGVSTVTRYIRYYSLYAALSDFAAQHGLDAAACRRLVRRSEVLLAALPPHAEADPSWSPHGADRVRRFHTEDLALAQAADEEKRNESYSPRAWGFWSQYGTPSSIVGTVDIRDGALRAGRHRCPSEVRALFAPLLSLALSERDTVSATDLNEAGQAALGSPCPAEREWLTNLFTATGVGAIHVPEEWETTDRTRRATLRVLARSIELRGPDGDTFEETMRSAVAFGDSLHSDPVLARIPQAAGWRGVLLRHYSVGAWRRLWAALVADIGSQDGAADRSVEELCDWLAQQAPSRTLRQFLNGLPPLKSQEGRLLPAERELLREYGDTPMAQVSLLVVGALRSREGHLEGDERALFLSRRRGSAEFLDPTWVDGLIKDYADRPARDFAARLVEDMLAQSRRVALAKSRIDPATGRVKLFSRLHLRNERYFKTGEEGSANIGTRLPQLGFVAQQLGLFSELDGKHIVTADGRARLGGDR